MTMKNGRQADLFSNDPAFAPRGRGRPAFAKTEEMQWVVNALRRRGVTQAEISAQTGISLSTLKRYFFTTIPKTEKGEPE